MVFGSVPVFLDPPNWPQQEQNQHPHHEGNNGNIITGHEVFHHQQLPPLPQNPNPNPNHHASGGIPARSGGGGSMSERARLAKIPQPEGSLKCPRCESTNTKFCYFNNYSLTQPRHFCKTCRRYWTRGGALRNVPVGGGCRRNTRKGKNGNSSKQNSNGQASSKQITSYSSVMSEGVVSNIGQTNSQFPFMATLQNLSQFGNNIGLNLTGIGTPNGNVHSSLMNDLGFLQVGAGSNNNNSINQFDLFDRANIGLYPFNSDGNVTFGSTARVSQTASVKMEENNLLNLSRHMSGFNSSENNNNNPFWVGASDFSGINNSSSNNQIL